MTVTPSLAYSIEEYVARLAFALVWPESEVDSETLDLQIVLCCFDFGMFEIPTGFPQSCRPADAHRVRCARNFTFAERRHTLCLQRA